MADPAEGSAVETVADAPVASPEASTLTYASAKEAFFAGDDAAALAMLDSAATPGGTGNDSTADDPDASPDEAASSSEEDGQDAADKRPSRKERQAQARARNGQFTAADETTDQAIDSEAEPAAPATFTEADVATRAKDLAEQIVAERETAAKTTETAASAESQRVTAVAEMIGEAPGRVNPKVTQYDEIVSATKDRNWDTLAQYGVAYGDLDHALDITKALDVQRVAWADATSIADQLADRNAWSKIDTQHAAIATLPGVDTARVLAATKGPTALLDSVRIAVASARDNAVNELKATHAAEVNDFKGQVATLEAKLLAATTRRASESAAPDAGGRPGNGTHIYTRSELANMPLSAYRANKAEIERQELAGRIQ